MEANAFWIVLAVVALLLAVLLRRRRGLGADVAESREATPVHPYHSVAVKSATGACEQARRIRGRRYLSAEAPSLPLPGCRARDCACVYAHFDDRRQGSRRHMLAARSAGAVGSSSADRRVTPGRRKADLVAAHPSH